jgi:hypothetical protein
MVGSPKYSCHLDTGNWLVYFDQRIIIAEVVSAVKQWRVAARRLHISSSEQDRIARAFRVAESYQPVG